jgi:V/A-type H+-transporting ATPase subunit I
MKRVELSVLDRDVDGVIEHLGRHALMHFAGDEGEAPGEERHSGEASAVQENLEKLRGAAVFLGLEIPDEPDESSVLPGPDELALTERICEGVESLNRKEQEILREKKKVEEALGEANAFANLNAPFADLDQLSYLTLRIGKLGSEKVEDLRNSLADRAVIIPLGTGDGDDRILAAASRKGRFALDSELKKQSFVPIAIPQDYKGVPAELLAGLQDRLKGMEQDLKSLEADRQAARAEYGPSIRTLQGSFLMAAITGDLKSKLRSTKSVYLLSGWVPADSMNALVEDLERLTGGRVAVRSFDPNEIPEVRDGSAKVPVALGHGAFVRGFEGVVFSYGAPLYGAIDPTPLVAFFFTVLFGIMFGDVGQGFVLLLAGLLVGRRGAKALSKLRGYSTPLIAVGISSMIMGFLNGEFFASEECFVRPTRALTGFLTGRPVDRILTLMPLAEKGGSVRKLFYFFGFTVGVGIIFNSIGLLVNIVNQWSMKRYGKALFAKTGVAGFALFWYAIAVALRCAAGGSLAWFDVPGLAIPVCCIFFGPALERLLAGQKPVLEHGLMVFIMEGFVEILETVSTYVSNTVSFLRVGAFALSHAVLSFIIFKLSEMVLEAAGGVGGSAAFLLVMLVGNAVIILLEGMIVAIQVVRLQYYEFFSKFFTDTGVEFSPFRYRREV